MEKSKLDIQLDAYFSGKMTDGERRAFQAQIKKDVELKSAFLEKTDQLADAAIQQMGQADLSGKIKKLRAEGPPLPEPKLSLWDKLELLVRTPIGAIGATIAATAVLLMLVANLMLPTTDVLINNYYVKPYEPPVAGDIRKDLIYKAYGFYNASSLAYSDSLQNLCPDFCIATYYRAHKHLRDKQYDKAITDFEQVVKPANWASLSTEAGIQDKCKVEFNLLLARLGKEKNKFSTVSNLDNLLTDQKQCSGATRNRAAALRKEFVHPLRFLKLD